MRRRKWEEGKRAEEKGGYEGRVRGNEEEE